MARTECEHYHAPCICTTNKYCERDIEKPDYCFGNFCKMVMYGRAGWSHNSQWIVPGTITDEERV